MSTEFEGERGDDDPIGPGTDLVISLFCTFLVLTVLGGALRVHSQRWLETAEKPAVPKPLPMAQTIILDPVKDGLQYFDRRSFTVSPDLVGVIKGRLSPLKDGLFQAKGGLLVHVIGHASPEPFGHDPGGANFELALRRAMSIATLLNAQLGIPFECMRVHGVGRGESGALRQWLDARAGAGPAAWDREYLTRREAEKRGWRAGETDWEAEYAKGRTDLGRTFGAERKVVLQTESAESALCARSLEDPAPPEPSPKAFAAPEKYKAKFPAPDDFLPPERGAAQPNELRAP